MEYKCIYNNFDQIKKDLMDIINQAQKRARLHLLDETDVEWAIEKMKENKNGKIELIGGSAPFAYKSRTKATYVKIAFLHRKEKTAIRVYVERIRRDGVINKIRKYKELPLTHGYDDNISTLYGDFVGLKRQSRVIRYIFFREVREKIRNELKQWKYVFPFRHEDFVIETVVIRRGTPLVVTTGTEINSGRYATYFILPKPYGSFQFKVRIEDIAPKEKIKMEKVFQRVTGKKIPDTLEEIAATLTMAAI